MNKRALKMTLVAGLLLFLLAGGGSCTGPPPPEDEQAVGEETEKPPEQKEEERKEATGEKNDEDAAGNEIDDGELPPEVRELEPNELGQFMVLMYHEIGYPESEWRRTPENFRKDLETLYELGYRAVSLTDALEGNIDLPAGTSPVVLTFDDGNRGNFHYLEENGELVIDPDCAVGIMLDFYEENPDFGLEGTFYIFYPNPFRQPEYAEKKLKLLDKKGFEIGNHTYGHKNLSRISDEEVRRELALHVRETRKHLPGYEVNSLALPYGAYPQNKELAAEGSFEGVEYRNEAVLLVGANPAPSPFHEDFNPLRLPRIRASEMHTEGVGMYDWIEYFKENPHRRYIADGDPRYVTAPESLQEQLDETWMENREVRFYPE